MFELRPIISACLLALLAAACASGGGGDSPPPGPQSFPPALRGQTFQAMAISYDGVSQSATAAVSPEGTTFHLSTNSASETLTLPPPGSTISGNLGYPTLNASLSHMAFGQWNNSAAFPSALGGGFFVFGSATPGPSIPTTGSATYNGTWLAKSMVIFVLVPVFTTVEGTITGNASFAARTVSLSAANSSGTAGFSGTLSYPQGSNSLSGVVSGTAGTGSADARFFGPNAQELGGTFNLSGPVSRLSGVFAMKR